MNELEFVISDFDNKINVFDFDKSFNQLGCIEPGICKKSIYNLLSEDMEV